MTDKHAMTKTCEVCGYEYPPSADNWDWPETLNIELTCTSLCPDPKAAQIHQEHVNAELAAQPTEPPPTRSEPDWDLLSNEELIDLYAEYADSYYDDWEPGTFPEQEYRRLSREELLRRLSE